MSEIHLTVKNKSGLHARPAASFVQTARAFKSVIHVKNGEKEADAKSILGILTLGVNNGTNIVITATGEDEEAALAALSQLAQNNFGENE